MRSAVGTEARFSPSLAKERRFLAILAKESGLLLIVFSLLSCVRLVELKRYFSFDTQAYPESPLLDIDMQHEVTRAQSVNGWSSSINNIFFVFTQKSEDLCFDSTHAQCASNYFCAYHSSFGSNTLYAAMPYAASFSCNPGSSPNNNDADQTINVTSHEQIEAATDPLGNAWYDSTGAEIGDKCAWTFGTKNSSGGDVTWNGHSYILQKEWDNKVTGCVMTGP